MRLMVVVIALMLWVAAPTAQTTCNRACLTGFIDTYFKALVANDPSPVPLAANAKITSNARTVRFADAFWPAAERIVYRWDIVNERLGDTGTEAVVQNADGSKTRWGLEGMSPNFLGRRGWTKNTFKPGDQVKVVLWPLKTGEPGGTLQRATLPDGTEVVNFGRAGG